MNIFKKYILIFKKKAIITNLYNYLYLYQILLIYYIIDYYKFCSCIEVRNDLMSMRANVKGSIPVKLSLVVAFNAMPDSNKPRKLVLGMEEEKTGFTRDCIT